METPMTENTRYVTVLYHGGEPTWFTLDNPPVGLPELTTRMKVGSHYYFLSAETPIVDAASGTTLIFVQALSHHSLGGHNIDPEGKPYELTKVDRHDFYADANWREIDDPFAGLEVQVTTV
jgi:hypothetical protein